VDVGEDTALGNGNVAEKLVQFLVIADGELEMTRNDTRLLVVAGGIAGQLEDLGSQVLENSSKVDGSAWKGQDGSRGEQEAGTYQHRHAERSCPSSRVCGHDRRGTRDRPWTSGCEESEKRYDLERIRDGRRRLHKSKVAEPLGAQATTRRDGGANSRLSAGLGGAGLASGLASSHFG
jgi:hypothetical protein